MIVNHFALLAVELFVGRDGNKLQACPGRCPHRYAVILYSAEHLNRRLTETLTLLPELRQGCSQGSARRLNQSSVRLIHFKDQVDRTANRQRRSEEANHYHRIGTNE